MDLFNEFKTSIDENIMDSNEKRKASCKAVGSDKKKTGHKREQDFGDRWCDDAPITYKAEADKVITNTDLLNHLRRVLGAPIIGRTSIKSGNNLQFTLGRIDEISNASDKLSAIQTKSFWNKYLGKSDSGSPADVLCYRDTNTWIFFAMQSVIDFIVKNAQWRLLESGRIKGDFLTPRGRTQYLTYEYRTTHKSYFLGANGNKGRPFIDLLIANLPHFVAEDK
jgi:hypothetical protein